MAFLSESVLTMNEANPRTTFRGLPLTDAQDSEIRHYIHTRQRHGAQWDTAELQAMLADMLNPPEVAADDDALDDSMAAERATAHGEEAADSNASQSR